MQFPHISRPDGEEEGVFVEFVFEEFSDLVESGEVVGVATIFFDFVDDVEAGDIGCSIGFAGLKNIKHNRVIGVLE